MIPTDPNGRKVPPISVSFEEIKKKGFLPFRSPREKSSGYAHASPRVQIDQASDSLVQRTVETVWLSLLEQIEKASPGQEKCVLSLPFSQGLLFGELLWAHQTKAEKHGKFTVILNARPENPNRNSLDSPFRIRSKKEISSRRSSATDLRERISHPSGSPDYLQKFLEISERVLQCKKEKKKDFSISAGGFDREFFKTALFHHYPNYIHSIASKQKLSNPGLLQVVLKKGVRDLDDLKQKIDRLKSLADRVSQNSSQLFATPFRYQDPADLQSHPHFFNRKRTPPTESGPSHRPPKEEQRVFRASSEEIEIGQPFFPKKGMESDDLCRTPYSPLSLQEGIETDILSDCDLTSDSQNEYINWVIARLMSLVKDELNGRTPKTTQSDHWKRLWKQIDGSKHSKLNQSRIRELVSLKCELERTSFELIPYLNEDQEEKGLTKSAQMKWIEDTQIERSIYPPGAAAPIAALFVNGKELISEPTEWSRDVSLHYFRTLLSEFLLAQQKYTPRKAEQLLAGLFDFTNLQIHPVPVQDISILSMLKASTFGFGANVFWILKSFFSLKGQYEILETKDYMPHTVNFGAWGSRESTPRTIEGGDAPSASFDRSEGIFTASPRAKIDRVRYQPVYEFFTDEFGNCTTVRTAAFTLWKVKSRSEPKEELGIFITKLISSFSGATKKWSFRVEIPSFEPNPLCSLREQREIHRKLLGK